MKNKILNLENIISVFEKYIDKIYFDTTFNYNNIKTSDYEIILNDVLKTCFDKITFNKRDIIDEDNYSSNNSITECNNYYHYDLETINFNLLFPEIILKLIENKDITINIEEFYDFFKIIVGNYSSIFGDTKPLIKIFIHKTYGILLSRHIEFLNMYSNNPAYNKYNIVKETTTKIFNSLCKKYKGFISYDTTIICFKNKIPKDIFKELEKLELSYSLSKEFIYFYHSIIRIKKQKFLTNDMKNILPIKIKVGKMFYSLCFTHKTLGYYKTRNNISDLSMCLIEVTNENVSDLFYQLQLIKHKII